MKLFKCDVWAGIKCPIKGGCRYKKLWREDELSDKYQETGRIPRKGYVLDSGDVVIGKGSDSESLILFINNKNKKNNGI